MLVTIILHGDERTSQIFHELPKTKLRKQFLLKSTEPISYAAVIGPNASGKSTLLSIIDSINVDVPKHVNEDGEIKYDGESWSGARSTLLFDRETNVVKYSPQDYAKGSSKLHQILHSTTNSKSYGDALQMAIGAYSGAECASNYFGQWFVNHRKELKEEKDLVILIDEPETSNDLLTIGYIKQGFEKNLKALRPSGYKTQIITATHHPEFVAAASNIIELSPKYLKAFVSQWRRTLSKFEEM